MRRIVNQIDAKKHANEFVKDLQTRLQEPGGCVTFFGSSFRTTVAAQIPFSDDVSSEGQTLPTTVFDGEVLKPGDPLPNRDLSLVHFKLFGAETQERQLANAAPFEDFHLIATFATTAVTLEKQLDPVKIGTFSFPNPVIDKNCYWRQ